MRANYLLANNVVAHVIISICHNLIRHCYVCIKREIIVAKKKHLFIQTVRALIILPLIKVEQFPIQIHCILSLFVSFVHLHLIFLSTFYLHFPYISLSFVRTVFTAPSYGLFPAFLQPPSAFPPPLETVREHPFPGPAPSRGIRVSRTRGDNGVRHRIRSIARTYSVNYFHFASMAFPFQ